MKICPQCHQPMADDFREGVRLPPLKARIFDMIKRSQHIGVTAESINRLCFEGRASRVNIRTHISQINDLLAATEVQIKGNASGERGFYHLVRTRERQAC